MHYEEIKYVRDAIKTMKVQQFTVWIHGATVTKLPDAKSLKLVGCYMYSLFGAGGGFLPLRSISLLHCHN